MTIRTRFGPAFVDAVATALRRGRFTVDEVATLLGDEARAALDRGEPVPALRATENAGDAGTLIRLFLLGEPIAVGDAARALAPATVADAVAAGLLVEEVAEEVAEQAVEQVTVQDDRVRADRVRAALDLRPHADAAIGDDWWVLSDLEVRPGGAEADREHVLGTGAASMSLARATVRRPVDTLLDVGTGCGVQVLHALGHAARITATDVSPRALALADATLRLSGLADGRVELREGPWWEPVAGRRFDQIVANPPFVPGPPSVEHVYRDAGLGGDGASAMLVSSLPSYLAEGGVGQLLASWLITGEDWTERPRAWLAEAARAAAPGGLDAWVVQRDVADPALHVGTWLRDAGVDPASPAGREQADRWLDFFDAHGVLAVGFGFVTLRQFDGAGDEGIVVCEDLRQSHTDPLGPEVAAWLDRAAWLRGHDPLDARLRVPDTVALERGLIGTDEGWSPVASTLVRLDGPQWRHDVDEVGEALLAGCRGHLPLRDLIELLALAHGRDADELTAAALPVVRDLILHGCLEAAS